MAAPTYKAKGTKGQGTGNSISFTYPAVAANDLLLLVVYESDLKAITVAAGWTSRGKQFLPTASPTAAVYLYSKLATGSETGTEAITRTGTTGNTWGAQVYSYDGDNYISIESVAKNSNSSDTVTWSAISVGGTERTLSAIVVNKYGFAVTTPSGYTQNATDTLNDDTEFEINTKANVSSDGAVTATGGSADGWATFHVSIYNNTPVVIGGSRSFIVN